MYVCYSWGEAKPRQNMLQSAMYTDYHINSFKNLISSYVYLCMHTSLLKVYKQSDLL